MWGLPPPWQVDLEKQLAPLRLPGRFVRESLDGLRSVLGGPMDEDSKIGALGTRERHWGIGDTQGG
jgi:hypothetical protein